MKNKLLTILLNQYFIALATSLFIIYLLPDYFSKYKLELNEQTFISNNFRVYFPDLNDNGISEKLIAVIHENSSFMLYDDKDNLVDQWNFSGMFMANPDLCWFMDTDDDGFNEIYAVTQKADSVFLNCMEPYSQEGTNQKIKTIFIDKIKSNANKFGCGVTGARLSNYKTDGVKELFFTITTGFAGCPRNTYNFNSKTNLIKKSAHLTNVSYITDLVDINNDGFEEVMFKSGSYGNKLDSLYTLRSDNSLWLNVLDHNLSFLFEPVEIKMPYSRLEVKSYTRNGEVKLICLLNSGQKETSKSKLMVYTNLGIFNSEKEIPTGLSQLFLNSKKDKFLLFNTENGLLKKLNFELKDQSINSLEPNSELFEIDINEDGKKEWLNIPLDKSHFTIYQEDFKNGLSFNFPNNEIKRIYFGIKKTTDGNQVFIQTGDYYYIFNYDKNPYFYFKYLFYVIIYLLVLGFVLISIKGQKIRNDKKLAIEKQIAELQIKTIKNQVDPHFVFNAINTISGLMLKDNKLEADEFICKFSGLVRTTLQNSDSIVCTLQEEIEYVEKYISLQQVRFNQRFKYQLEIDKKVNLQEVIPKHILYSYVENAIKHGLYAKENGLLKIGVQLKENKLVLTIEDNGGGFDTSKNTKRNSTGNGMLIMEKIYYLYFKLYKKKIKHIIKEIVNDQNIVAGVRVSVFITS